MGRMAAIAAMLVTVSLALARRAAVQPVPRLAVPLEVGSARFSSGRPDRNSAPKTE